jgi:hypothetical protein
VDSFLKDSFRGFVLCKQKYQITRFVSIRKDSYTNPASLENSNNHHFVSNAWTDDLQVYNSQSEDKFYTRYLKVTIDLNRYSNINKYKIYFI